MFLLSGRENTDLHVNASTSPNKGVVGMETISTEVRKDSASRDITRAEAEIVSIDAPHEARLMKLTETEAAEESEQSSVVVSVTAEALATKKMKQGGTEIMVAAGISTPPSTRAASTDSTETETEAEMVAETEAEMVAEMEAEMEVDTAESPQLEARTGTHPAKREQAMEEKSREKATADTIRSIEYCIFAFRVYINRDMFIV